jgi:ABC-type glycerol-3-phosphate transport system permease component
MFLCLLLVLGPETHAQGCSQCRLVPQSDQQGGGTAAGGINKAILYLMALPYVILFLLFRKQIVSFYKQFRAKN